ncbi:MAG: hypothetical protein LC744_06730 [Chloroflexi bacterium]|nr:hypothetical protein [Chloroflexota bacterium]
MTRLLAVVWPDLRAPDVDTRPFPRMLDALDDLSPRVEAVDVGVALVDVTGLGPTWGTERRIAARAVMLARAVAPLSVRCGVGDNRWLATLAARLARVERPGAPAAFHALPAGAISSREALRDLPLTLLPADVATRQRLALFGLTAMGQLADLPRSAVGAQFGPGGERLQALARGHDPRPLVPRRRPERVVAGAGFDPPLDGIGTVGLTLRRLAAELCERLRARNLAPGRAVLVLALEDAPALRVSQPFPQPALEPDWIARLLLSRLESAARAPSCRPAEPTAKKEPNTIAAWSPVVRRGNFQPHSGPKLAVSSAPEQLAQLDEGREEPRITSVRLAFDRLTDPASRQMPAFEARAGRWEELRWSLERIRHRFGEGRLWRAVVDRPTAALPEHRSRLVDIGP